MKKNMIAAALIMAMLIFPGSVSFANDGGVTAKDEKAWSEKQETRRQELYRELNLTDAQKKLLEENRTKHKGQMKTLFGEIRDKRTMLRQELQKDMLDMANIAQINNNLKALQAEMQDYRLERILEVRKILTAEQFKKFSAKIEELAQHSKEKYKGIRQ